MPETERQAIAAGMLEQQVAATKRALSALASLVVPAGRRSIHDLGEQALRELAEALGELAEVARRDGLRLEDAQAAQHRHAAAMAGIRHLSEEIERIRVLEHSAQ